jgi:hypothetical protein
MPFLLLCRLLPPPLPPHPQFFILSFSVSCCLAPASTGRGVGWGRKWRSKRCKICDSFLVCHPSRKKPRRFSCEYIKVLCKKARQTANFKHFLTVLWDNLLFAFQIYTFCPNFSDYASFLRQRFCKRDSLGLQKETNECYTYTALNITCFFSCSLTASI